MVGLRQQVGAALRLLFERSHLKSRLQFARAIGVSSGTMSKILAGQQVTLETLEACLSVLGADLYDLADAVEIAGGRPAKRKHPPQIIESKGVPSAAAVGTHTLEQASPLSEPRPIGTYIEGYSRDEIRELLRGLAQDAIAEMDRRRRLGIEGGGPLDDGEGPTRRRVEEDNR